jgi:hypothetical protein
MRYAFPPYRRKENQMSQALEGIRVIETIELFEL